MSPPDLIVVLFAFVLVFWLSSIYRPPGRRVPVHCSQRPPHQAAEESACPFARGAPARTVADGGGRRSARRSWGLSIFPRRRCGRRPAGGTESKRREGAHWASAGRVRGRLDGPAEARCDSAPRHPMSGVRS